MTTVPSFDLDDPKLPDGIKHAALASGGFPYAEELNKRAYEDQLYGLQTQLVRLQSHAIATGIRIVLVFEGRDAAGKGGAISTYRENLNPRYNIIVALPKPSDREAGQWYFQRYVAHLPAAGETALFDRSWYNHGVVEPVMGFSTAEQTRLFLEEAPPFEELLVRDGIRLFKFWLDIGHEMQMQRFHDRKHDPLKTWKLSPVDYEALRRWDDYTAARDRMLLATDTELAPWTVIRANDKRRTRIGVLQAVLSRLEFEGKDPGAIGAIDPKIVVGVRGLLPTRASGASSQPPRFPQPDGFV